MKHFLLLLFLAGTLAGTRGHTQDEVQALTPPGTAGVLQTHQAQGVPARTLTGKAMLPGGEEFSTPIHTAKADPLGGTYGIWASGPDFKVSFHEGFTFYPYLGPAYPENLPWNWKTESITAGGRSLLPEGVTPKTGFTSRRFEYRYPGITEAYDVGKSGVEQTFVLSSPPPFRGDLVVTGRITTPLEADPVQGRHQSLLFKDQKGTSLVRYGSAWAVDAAGRKTEVTTSFDGRRIRLTLDGGWLGRASYPVTIDPLSSRVRVSYWGGSPFGRATYPEIGRDDLATKNNVMIVYGRQFSASDYDGYARIMNDDFSGSTKVYADISSTWSTVRLKVGFVGGARRWVVAMERFFPSNKSSAVRIHIRNSGDTKFSSTYYSLVPYKFGYTYRYPDVGGTDSYSSGNNALVVYQVDQTSTGANTTHSEVYGILVDAKNIRAGAPFALGPKSASFDQEYPSVCQVSAGGTDSWVAVWQIYDNNISKDDWDVVGARITPSGQKSPTAAFGDMLNPSQHKFFPRVEGQNGRFLVTYMTSKNTARFHGWWGTELHTQAFDWFNQSKPYWKGPLRIIWRGTCLGTSLAFDTKTASHWAVTYAVYSKPNYADLMVSRVGYTGGTVERATLGRNVRAWVFPSVTFDDDHRLFQVVYGAEESGTYKNSLYGARFLYPSNAKIIYYGTGCGGYISSDIPYAGTRYFFVNLKQAARKQPAILLVSTGPKTFPLNFMGMPGCYLNVGTQSLNTVRGVTDSNGFIRLSFHLFDYPALYGDAFFQWIYYAPGANSAGLLATKGLKVQIR